MATKSLIIADDLLRQLETRYEGQSFTNVITKLIKDNLEQADTSITGQRLSTLEEDYTKLKDDFKQLTERFKIKFDNINNRLDNVDKLFDDLNNK